MRTSLAVQAGDLVGTYRLEALVAKGGMGAVWQARHPTLDRPVAIKVIRAEARHNPDAREAFLREIRSLSRLRSPQTVQVIDSGFTETGAPWMATEFLEGEDLRQRIGRSGSLPVRDALFVGIEVLKSLSEAHALGIVHRDLKPGNIFLQRVPTVDGTRIAVKVLDFGVAKLLPVEGGDVESTLWPQAPVKGSPRYMAPEQVTGDPPVSPVSDLYAFAGMMYRTLSGQPVFEGGRDHLFEAHVALAPKPLAQRFPDLGVPAAVDDVILRCLAKQPRDRPASADHVRRALEQALTELPPAGGRAAARPPMIDSPTPAWLVGGGAASWGDEDELTTPSPGPIAAGASSPWVSADDLPLLGSTDMRAAWLEAGDSQPPAVSPEKPPLERPSNDGAAGDVPAGEDDALSAWLEAGVPGAEPAGTPAMVDDPDFAPPGTPAGIDPLAGLELAVDPAEVRRAMTASHPPAQPPPSASDASPLQQDAASEWLDASDENPHVPSAGPSGSVTYVPPPTSARVEGSGLPVGPAVAVVVVLAAAGVWFLGGGDADQPAEADATRALAAPEPTARRAPRLTAVPKRRDLRDDAGVRVPEGRGSSPITKDKATVTVIADPGPASFARADTGQVICPSSDRCTLEVDIDHIVKVKGYVPKRISGDDLYDRRGRKMRVILQPAGR